MRLAYKDVGQGVSRTRKLRSSAHPMFYRLLRGSSIFYCKWTRNVWCCPISNEPAAEAPLQLFTMALTWQSQNQKVVEM